MSANVTFENTSVELRKIKAAAEILEKESIRYVLVGTAALMVHGKLPTGFNAPDIDFLVERAPQGIASGAALPKDERSQKNSLTIKRDGVKVDYIGTNAENNTEMLRFFTPNPTYYDGVAVADLVDVLGLKASASRGKDFKFLGAWCEQFGELPERKKIAPKPVATPPTPLTKKRFFFW